MLELLNKCQAKQAAAPSQGYANAHFQNVHKNLNLTILSKRCTAERLIE